MAQDLRSFLDNIKRQASEDFLVVSREVDPAFEITAITVKLEQQAKQRPILLFEKVKGTKFPVLTNLHAGRSRLAAAIHAKPEEMQRAYLRAMEKPIAPKIVEKAPVKDVILTGDKVDLYRLPQVRHHQDDAGPYITAAISFAKDPTNEIWNCA
ncbi:MAG TPA: UbiD family decarboxylase, partial [Candidatus Binatia bacterium]